MRKNFKMFFSVPCLGVRAALLVYFVFTSVSHAGLYGITFYDPNNGDSASGQIDVVGGYAVSGYLDVTTGAASGYDWTLYTAGGSTTYPSDILSPKGGFDYDNAVYLDSTTNPQYNDNSSLDVYGLLFTHSSGDELNLWGNGGGSLTLYADIGNNRYNPQDISPTGGIFIPVPEPVNCALAGFGLVFIGCSVGRLHLRHPRSAVAS